MTQAGSEKLGEGTLLSHLVELRSQREPFGKPPVLAVSPGHRGVTVSSSRQDHHATTER